MERGNALFYECIEDAIKDDLVALGGPKKAAAIFFPDKTPDQGAALLRAWGNAERAERPSPAQYLLLKSKAKEANSYACWRYEEHALHVRVQHVEPEEELTILLREYLEDDKRQSQRRERIDGLIAKTQLRAVR